MVIALVFLSPKVILLVEEMTIEAGKPIALVQEEVEVF